MTIKAHAGLALSTALICGILLAQRGVSLDRNAERTGRRVALVIGNSDYPGPRHLDNPLHDAEDMTEKLKKLHFDPVIYGPNLTIKKTSVAWTEFLKECRAGDVCLFYYAGHGVEVSGKNYLLPIDDDSKTAEELSFSVHPVQDLQDNVAAHHPAVQIYLLDACRTDPLPERGARGGLAPMSGGDGTYVGFATSPLKPAAENSGERNGLFTKYLLQALDRPAVKFEDVLKETKRLVVEASKGAQRPWFYSDSTEDFYLNPDPQERARLLASALASAEAEYWSSIRGKTEKALFTAYLSIYPDGPHSAEAKSNAVALEPRHVQEVDSLQSRLTSVAQQSFRERPKFALLVGISRYMPASGLPSLRYPASDARDVGEVLARNGYRVETLIDETATRAAVLHALARLSLETRDSTAIVYFTGHGFQVEGRSYLASYDATVDDLRGTAVPIDEVYAVQKRSGIQRVAMFIDASRSSPFSGFRQQSLLDLTSEGVRSLFSTGPGRDSFESAELRHGVFSYFVAKGLSGEAAGSGGWVTFNSLEKYVSDSVRQYSGLSSHGPQVPFSVGEASGDFILAARR